MKFIKYVTIFIFYMLSINCGNESTTIQIAESKPQELPSIKPAPPQITDDVEEVIWEGDSGKFSIRWTNKDIYIEKDGKIEKLFTDFAKKYYDINFKYESDYSTKLNKYVKTKKLNSCDISINGKIASLIGQYLTLEIEEFYFCGVVQYYSHWIVFDLENQDNVQFVSDEKDSYAIGRGLKLTDFFDDQEIIEAFLSDSEVKETVKVIGKGYQPKSTSELLNWFHIKSEIYSETDYAKKPFEFENIAFEKSNYALLNNRALTGFAFNRLEDEKFIVQVSLTPHFKKHGIEFLELKLNVPNNLRDQLKPAEPKQSGFLGKDLNIISGGDFSKIDFDGLKK